LEKKEVCESIKKKDTSNKATRLTATVILFTHFDLKSSLTKRKAIKIFASLAQKIGNT
jgi:hypothetical protein